MLVLHVKSRSEACPWVLTSTNELEFVCIFLKSEQLNVPKQFPIGSTINYSTIFLPQKLYVKDEIKYILSILYEYISSW